MRDVMAKASAMGTHSFYLIRLDDEGEYYITGCNSLEEAKALKSNDFGVIMTGVKSIDIKNPTV